MYLYIVVLNMFLKTIVFYFTFKVQFKNLQTNNSSKSLSEVPGCKPELKSYQEKKLSGLQCWVWATRVMPSSISPPSGYTSAWASSGLSRCCRSAWPTTSTTAVMMPLSSRGPNNCGPSCLNFILCQRALSHWIEVVLPYYLGMNDKINTQYVSKFESNVSSWNVSWTINENTDSESVKRIAKQPSDFAVKVLENARTTSPACFKVRMCFFFYSSRELKRVILGRTTYSI